MTVPPVVWNTAVTEGGVLPLHRSFTAPLAVVQLETSAVHTPVPPSTSPSPNVSRPSKYCVSTVPMRTLSAVRPVRLSVVVKTLVSLSNLLPAAFSRVTVCVSPTWTSPLLTARRNRPSRAESRSRTAPFSTAISPPTLSALRGAARSKRAVPPFSTVRVPAIACPSAGPR